MRGRSLVSEPVNSQLENALRCCLIHKTVMVDFAKCFVEIRSKISLLILNVKPLKDNNKWSRFVLKNIHGFLVITKSKYLQSMVLEIIIFMCVLLCVWYVPTCAHVGGRGQLSEVISLLPPLHSFWGSTQVIRFVLHYRCLCPLSQVTGPIKVSTENLFYLGQLKDSLPQTYSLIRWWVWDARGGVS